MHGSIVPGERSARRGRGLGGRPPGQTLIVATAAEGALHHALGQGFQLILTDFTHRKVA